MTVSGMWLEGLARLHHLTGMHTALQAGAILSFLSGTCALVLATRLTFTRAIVHNFDDPGIFTAPQMVGFIHQSADHPSLLRFRTFIEDVLIPGVPPLQTAVALRKWVRSQQPESKRCWYPRRAETEDPEQLLKEQHEGVPGACRRFSYILTGALLSAGLNARLVVFGKSFDQRTELSHSVVEVWCEELRKWVLLDATYDTIIRIDGMPASAFELYRSLQAGDDSKITFDRDGSERAPAPRLRAYQSVCGHIFVAQTNAIFDGFRVRMFGKRRISFAHFVNEGEKPYPESTKRILFRTAIGCFATYLLFWTALVSL